MNAAFFSYRIQYDVIEFSNCNAEERSEASNSITIGLFQKVTIQGNGCVQF